MTAPHVLSTVGRQVLRVLRERGPDGGEVEETEWLVGPGWSALPVHHHHGDERYEILGGRVRVVVDGAGRTYRAGESVIVAAGRSHTLQPVDGHGLHVRVQRWSPRHHRGEPRPTPHLT
jgi:mannose-6-phosphate isomerase-like protein (cupin superfamily)